MSPALWISPSYISQVNGGPKKPLRVHLDMGTSEGQPYFDQCLSMYDTHFAQGHVANDDVEFVAGCGQPHDESAWAARLPAVLDYLLPAGENPNELAQRDYPPKFAVTIVDLANSNATFNYTSLFGFKYTLLRSSDLTSWSSMFTTTAESFPWATRSLSDGEFAPATQMFWRLLAEPAP